MDINYKDNAAFLQSSTPSAAEQIGSLARLDNAGVGEQLDYGMHIFRLPFLHSSTLGHLQNCNRVVHGMYVCLFAPNTCTSSGWIHLSQK